MNIRQYRAAAVVWEAKLSGRIQNPCLSGARAGHWRVQGRSAAGHSLQIGGRRKIAPCPLFAESDAKSEPWHPSRGGTVAASHCDSPIMMVAQLYRACGGARPSGDSSRRSSQRSERKVGFLRVPELRRPLRRPLPSSQAPEAASKASECV